MYGISFKKVRRAMESMRGYKLFGRGKNRKVALTKNAYLLVHTLSFQIIAGHTWSYSATPGYTFLYSAILDHTRRYSAILDLFAYNSPYWAILSHTQPCSAWEIMIHTDHAWPYCAILGNTRTYLANNRNWKKTGIEWR